MGQTIPSCPLLHSLPPLTHPHHDQSSLLHTVSGRPAALPFWGRAVPRHHPAFSGTNWDLGRSCKVIHLSSSWVDGGTRATPTMRHCSVRKSTLRRQLAGVQHLPPRSPCVVVGGRLRLVHADNATCTRHLSMPVHLMLDTASCVANSENTIPRWTTTDANSNPLPPPWQATAAG